MADGSDDERDDGPDRGGGQPLRLFDVRALPREAALKRHKVYVVRDKSSKETPPEGAPMNVSAADRRYWEVVERDNSDSVAILVYVKATKEIVLQERFRAGVVVRDTPPEMADGRIREPLAAGYDPDGELTPLESAVEAVRTMSNYALPESAMSFVTTFYASPGGSSERIHVYFAVAAHKTRPPTPPPTRDITSTRPLIRHVPVRSFFAWMETEIESRRPIDLKLVICAQALRRWLNYADQSALE